MAFSRISVRYRPPSVHKWDHKEDYRCRITMKSQMDGCRLEIVPFTGGPTKLDGADDSSVVGPGWQGRGIFFRWLNRKGKVTTVIAEKDKADRAGPTLTDACLFLTFTFLFFLFFFKFLLLVARGCSWKCSGRVHRAHPIEAS